MGPRGGGGLRAEAELREARPFNSVGCRVLQRTDHPTRLSRGEMDSSASTVAGSSETQEVRVLRASACSCVVYYTPILFVTYSCISVIRYDGSVPYGCTQSTLRMAACAQAVRYRQLT